MSYIKPFAMKLDQENLDSTETTATQAFIEALEAYKLGPIPDDPNRGFCELFKVEVAQGFTCDARAERLGEEIEAVPNYKKTGGKGCKDCMYWGPIEDARVGAMVPFYKNQLLP